MSHHILDYDEVCPSCKGTGLYEGFAEKNGAAVVCQTCKGTGCHHVRIEYDEFTKRSTREGVKRVFEVNPGIGLSGGNLEQFGGMPYQDWIRNKPFPPGSENRKYICPAWWYQSANYDLKPDWDKCPACGTFTSCDHFKDKKKCWERFDEEHGEIKRAPIQPVKPKAGPKRVIEWK